MMKMMGIMTPATGYEVDPDGRDRAVKYWMYGPEQDNDTQFWEDIADSWGMEVEAAQLQRCSNCDYYDNRVSVLKTFDAPVGTGFCTKFDFLCAEDKTCQMWCCDNDYYEPTEMDD